MKPSSVKIKSIISGSKIAWLLSVGLSLVIRIPDLLYRSGGFYNWRPLQTELTSYWFAKEGIDLLHYQTPLYGPPWQVPFEFPLFQAISVLVANTHLLSLDQASRLTALFFFYVTGLLVYLLCREFIEDNLTNFVIITLFLWLPFDIYYSTQALIDYLSAALALGYLFFILVWLKKGRTWWSAILATICGTLGILVKPTTTPIVAIPILVFVIRDIVLLYKAEFTRPFNLRGLWEKIWSQWLYWGTLAVMAVVPVLAGNIWTNHADKIKDNSIFTRWLSSKALTTWVYGTWDLRLNGNAWAQTFFYGLKYLLPYWLPFLAVVGICAGLGLSKDFKDKTEARLFIASILASAILVLTTFLNLYKQPYYYIALSASTAILMGYGLVRAWKMIGQIGRPVFTVLFVAWVLMFVTLNVTDYKVFHNISIDDSQIMDRTETWAREVQRNVATDDGWLVAIQRSWTPTYIFLLERKTMVVSPEEIDKPVCQMVSDERFKWVVVPTLDYKRNPELIGLVLHCFRSAKQVMPGLYQVTH